MGTKRKGVETGREGLAQREREAARGNEGQELGEKGERTELEGGGDLVGMGWELKEKG